MATKLECVVRLNGTTTDPWSISHLISGRPWLAGKQLPLGLNEMDLGSGYKLISVDGFSDVSLNTWRRLKSPGWE